jgi:3'-phosphoadenosine 5'-phosphosulfate sulfotransferase (PAPS reductase)/FAD synthetase
MFCTAPDAESTPSYAHADRPSAAKPPAAASLNRFLSDAEPVEILRTARELVGRERLAVVSSFGVESAALLKLVADVDPAIPVLLLDTGWLFAETLAHRDAVVDKLGLTDVRSIKPAAHAVARLSPADVVAIARAAGLPPHPLAVHGFTSVGCMPCTRRARPGEGPRAGRWRGTGKTECGIHTMRPA